MKTYKMKADGKTMIGTISLGEVEVSADEIRRLIRENPELAKGEEVRSRFFSPENGEAAYYLLTDGKVESSSVWESEFDEKQVKRGIYRTREEAELADQKRMAIVRLWNWADENAHFRPYWKTPGLFKHYVSMGDYLPNSGLTVQSCCLTNHQFSLPYFNTREDCQRFIEANRADLELLFLS